MNGPVLIGIFIFRVDPSLMQLPNGRMNVGSVTCSFILVQTASEDVAARLERNSVSEPAEQCDMPQVLSCHSIRTALTHL